MSSHLTLCPSHLFSSKFVCLVNYVLPSLCLSYFCNVVAASSAPHLNASLSVCPFLSALLSMKLRLCESVPLSSAYTSIDQSINRTSPLTLHFASSVNFNDKLSFKVELLRESSRRPNFGGDQRPSFARDRQQIT